MRPLLAPIATLWLLALSERQEGAAYVTGLGLTWSLEVAWLTFLVKSLRTFPRWSTLALVELGGVVPAGIVLSVGERWLWPTRDLNRYADVLGECLLASHVAAMVWALTSVLPRLSLESSLRRAEAQRLEVVAELATLRAQLMPHFIRNTLHAVAGLIETDAECARELLADLGDLLEASGRDPGELEPLREHLHWLRTYTRILEIRYGERLSFAWQIDPALEELPVPRLLLQPLVENAVEHGALRAGSEARVRVVAMRDGEQVTFRVEDNGPGFSSTAVPSVGLSTVRRRFQLFAPDGDFAIASTASGTVVALSFASELA